MDIDKVPVLGRINRTLTVMMINFILLAVVCVTLGIVIPFYPQVLDLFIAALLIVSAVILLNIAYNIHTYKSKYMKYFK
jgi:flagellar biosynthesis component FlhA